MEVQFWDLVLHPIDVENLQDYLFVPLVVILVEFLLLFPIYFFFNSLQAQQGAIIAKHDLSIRANPLHLG
jgi:hypothetical protein